MGKITELNVDCRSASICLHLKKEKKFKGARDNELCTFYT